MTDFHSDANIILNMTTDDYKDDDEDNWSGASGSGDGTDDGGGAGFTPSLHHPTTRHPVVSTKESQVSDSEGNFLPIACGITVAVIITIIIVIFLIIFFMRRRNKKKARLHREYLSQNTEMTVRAMNNRPLQAAPTPGLSANGGCTSAKSAASANGSAGAKAGASPKCGEGSKKDDKAKGRKDSSSSLPSTSAPPPPYSSVVQPSAPSSSSTETSAAAETEEKKMAAEGETTYLSVPDQYDTVQNSDSSSLHGYEVTAAENHYEVV